MKNINTELERKLYIEIMGTRDGLKSYLDFAREQKYQHHETFKKAEIKFELLQKLAQIIENNEKQF